MEPIQIALIVLVLAGIWALVELALVLRRTRSTVDSLDKTVKDLNNTLAEAQPIVAKLDGAIDELQPALVQIEPLVSSANDAVAALTSTIVEVEGVVRDVSAVSGAAASAGDAVSALSDSASSAVSKLIDKVTGTADEQERILVGETMSASDGEAPSDEKLSDDAAVQQYYTYGTDASDSEDDND